MPEPLRCFVGANAALHYGIRRFTPRWRRHAPWSLIANEEVQMKSQKAAFVAIAGVVLAAASYMAASQAKTPKFEVASIKPNAAGDHCSLTQLTSGGRLNVTGA